MRTRVCGACCTTGSARQPRSGKSLIATSRPTRGCREARPSTSRAGPSANQTGAPAHTFGHRLREALGLEELQLWYPSAAVPRRSSSLALLSARVGVIRSLPYRAQLVLEVPLNGPYRVSPPLAATGGAYVPDVRVWATWEDGVRPTSYHVYPDASLCTYTPGEWIWGRDPLHELLDWCVCWLAKTLHLQFLGRWPGRQHCSANVAMKRRMLDEYCRCGGNKLYRECHYAEDRDRSAYELFREEEEAAAGYLLELRRRGRPAGLPWGP